jgi:hypothetical protein
MASSRVRHLGRHLATSACTSTDQPELLSRIHSPEGQEVLQRCREMYLTRGFCHVPNFITQEVCDRLIQGMQSVQTVFVSDETHTAYQEEPDTTQFSPDHPRNRLLNSRKTIIDWDRIPADSPLKALYHDDRLLHMIKSIVGLDQLFVSECPFNGKSSAVVPARRSADSNLCVFPWC